MAEALAEDRLEVRRSTGAAAPATTTRARTRRTRARTVGAAGRRAAGAVLGRASPAGGRAAEPRGRRAARPRHLHRRRHRWRSHDGRRRSLDAAATRPPSRAARRAARADDRRGARPRSGAVRQDVTAVAVGVGPGPVHRPAGRAGHRAHARAGARRPGVRRVQPRRARARRGRRRGRPEPFLVATDARRKEVYWASYDGTASAARRAARRPARRRRRPTGCRRRARRRCSTPTRSADSRAPTHPDAAALARAGRRGAGRAVDPEPLYLRRPDAAAPAPRRRCS